MGVSIAKKRSWTARAVAVAATASAAVYGVVVGGHAANAATSSLITVTGVSPHLVAATTANRVITVTGTGFDEDSITGVTIAGCTTAPTYVVSSATTLLLKTANDCAAGTGAVITVTDTSSNTAVSDPTATGGKMKLDFVAPPTIATADGSSVRPIVTLNSAGQAFTDQVHTGSTSGGTVVKVYAGSTPFVNSTATPLSASIDGVALTKVTMHTGGDYFTGVLGAHAADAAPVLKITSGGVSKSFQYDGSTYADQTHDFQLAGTTISISPASGPIDGGNTVTISGTGFTNATTATVGGTACTTVTFVSSKKITCDVPSVNTAGPVTVATSTAGLASIVSAGSTYTYLDQ